MPNSIESGRPDVLEKYLRLLLLALLLTSLSVVVIQSVGGPVSSGEIYFSRTNLTINSVPETTYEYISSRDQNTQIEHTSRIEIPGFIVSDLQVAELTGRALMFAYPSGNREVYRTFMSDPPYDSPVEISRETGFPISISPNGEIGVMNYTENREGYTLPIEMSFIDLSSSPGKEYLRFTDYAAAKVSWSPNGEYVVLENLNNYIRVVSTQTFEVILDVHLETLISGVHERYFVIDIEVTDQGVVYLLDTEEHIWRIDHSTGAQLVQTDAAQLELNSEGQLIYVDYNTGDVMSADENGQNDEQLGFVSDRIERVGTQLIVRTENASNFLYFHPEDNIIFLNLDAILPRREGA